MVSAGGRGRDRAALPRGSGGRGLAALGASAPRGQQPVVGAGRAAGGAGAWGRLCRGVLGSGARGSPSNTELFPRPGACPCRQHKGLLGTGNFGLKSEGKSRFFFLIHRVIPASEAQGSRPLAAWVSDPWPPTLRAVSAPRWCYTKPHHPVYLPAFWLWLP